MLRELRARRAAGSAGTFTEYQTDPVGYAYDVLGATLTDDQAAILESIRDHRRTAVKASHAIGKTFVAGIAANWWYDCWDQNIVYVTAPSWPQALGLTFKEIKRVRRARRLPGDILDSGLVRDPDKEREPGHFIRALNAQTGEGFQGEHTAPILIILEEAVGVPRYIWEAADGLMTHPECRELAIANPTNEANDFGELASSAEAHTLTISALRHPNIVAEIAGQPPPFPKAVRLLWLKEMLAKECERVDRATDDCFTWLALPQVEKILAGQPASDSAPWIYKPNAVFQGRVLGEFPTQADTQVIPKAWLRLCDSPQDPRGPVEIGADIARFGTDRTTIFARQGACVLIAREVRQLNLELVTGEIKALAAAAEAATGVKAKLIPIKIDVTGGLGAGPADTLRGEGYQVRPVNSSARAHDADAYPNRRSELWFSTREAVRTRHLDLTRLPADLRERLEKELALPTWHVDGKGRKVVESKDEMKKRLGSSPDLADGLNLAFYGAPVPGAPQAGPPRPPLVGQRGPAPVPATLPLPPGVRRR